MEGHRGWVDSVTVSPVVQCGEALMNAYQLNLIERGCRKVNLQMRADDDAVVTFYESLCCVVEERVSLGRLIEPN